MTDEAPEWGYMPKDGSMTMGDGTQSVGPPPVYPYDTPPRWLVDLFKDGNVDPERRVGLVKKYDVIWVNDPDGKHANCWYFVLDPQHDPLAREALKAYAEAAEREGYAYLAADLHRRRLSYDW